MLHVDCRYRYDDNFDGTGDDCGRVTAVEVLAPGNSVTNWLRTTYEYDGFGRQNVTTTTDPDATGNLLPIKTVQSYDSAGRPTFSRRYTVDGATETLIAQTENVYSGIYLSEIRQYEINHTTGTATSNYLVTKYEYGDLGRVAKVTNPGGSFTKTEYSLGGNVTSKYIATDEGTDTSPTTTTGDTIVEQTDYAYDNFGNVIQTISYKRHSDATTTGAFTTSTSDARVSYTAAWYDSLGRMTDSANYGALTTALSRPIAAPSSSDTVLVTSYDYDGFGLNNLTTDAAGISALQVFDIAGRLIFTVKNFIPNTTGQEDYWYTTAAGKIDYNRPKSRDSDENQITRFEYNNAGLLLRQTVVDPAADNNESANQADNQTTRYFYASELDATHQGTPTPRGDLLRAERYGDSTLTDQQVIDILNEESGAPTSHDFIEYSYNADGSLATRTDQRGVVHSYTYDNFGRLTLDEVTNLGTASENVDSSVRATKTEYNSLGQVTTITSYAYDASDNPTVVVNQILYQYDNSGNVTRAYQEHDGAVNISTSLYVEYAYDNYANSLRLKSVKYPNGRIVHYTYGTSGGVSDRLSRVDSIRLDSTTTPGTPGDVLSSYEYLGAGTIVSEDYEQPNIKLNSTIDRFGRITDQLWRDYGSSTDVDHYSYTYDRNSNRTSRDNELLSALDEVYTYDDLDRLIDTKRNGVDYQSWALDGLGNWDEFTDQGTTDTNTFDAANQQSNLTYDSAGNLTNDGTLKYTYDAWNRQVAVRKSSDNSAIAEYEFDGLNRRVTKTVGTDSTEYLYNESWQVLEEKTNAATPVVTQYTWSLSYVDSPIARFRDANADGDCDDANETLYYTSDANYNVTSIVNRDGNVVERYVYDPHGNATISDAAWAIRADGGDANTTAGDESIFDNQILYAGYRYDPETAIISLTVSGTRGNYHVRNRQYSPTLGKFTTRDPLGYAAGDENLYRYVENNPTSATDPSGLEKVFTQCMKDGLWAYWQVEKNDWANSDTEDYYWLGPVDDDGLISLTDEFGGGTIGLAMADLVARVFWRSTKAIDGKSKSHQIIAIKGAIVNSEHAWKSTYRHLAGSFFYEFGTSFADGRAWDSFQGGVYGAVDKVADGGIAVANTAGAGVNALSGALGGGEIVGKLERTVPHLNEIIDPLYGNKYDYDNGTVVGDYTVRAMAIAVAAHGIVQLPGIFNSLCAKMGTITIPVIGSSTVNAGGGMLALEGGLSIVIPRGLSAAVVGGIGVGSGAGYMQSFGDPLLDWLTEPAYVKSNRAATGNAANTRAANIKKGIPENQLGPSGKPKIHSPNHSSLKKAKDAARGRGYKGGTTTKHSSPTKGRRHFHGKKSDGTKIRVHDEYPG